MFDYDFISSWKDSQAGGLFNMEHDDGNGEEREEVEPARQRAMFYILSRQLSGQRMILMESVANLMSCEQNLNRFSGVLKPRGQ